MANHILVTTEIDDKQQQMVEEILYANQTTVHFLGSVSKINRNKILRVTNILLTFNPVHDLTMEEFEQLKNVSFIQLISAGADHIPYKNIPEGIIIACNPGAYAEPIAEHALAMALALAKRLKKEHQNMIRGEFNQFNSTKSIRNSTIGIIGLGGIGKATAHLFQAFGARIFAINTSGKSNITTNFIGTIQDLRYISESSDIIVLSLPLNNDTRGLIGKEQLGWMKPDAILINVARGEIINQKELYEHLKARPEFKAGLESWWVEPLRHGSFELEYPLLDLPNVLASPHNSSMIPGIMGRGITEAAKNIKRYLKGMSFKGEINRKKIL